MHEGVYARYCFIIEYNFPAICGDNELKDEFVVILNETNTVYNYPKSPKTRHTEVNKINIVVK